MRELFCIDLKNYNPAGKVNSRPSYRGIVEKDGKILALYSLKYDFYMLPGGGKKENETDIEALIREMKEETGYTVIEKSIKEFGMVPRLQKDSKNEDEIFSKTNHYYFCDIEAGQGETSLEDYEKDAELSSVWINPFEAYHHNLYHRPSEGEDAIFTEIEGKVFNQIDLEFIRRKRKEREREYIKALGNPQFSEMLEFVKSVLSEGESEKLGVKLEINYSRFEHTKRVLKFSKKLYDMAEDKTGLRYEDLIIATIFHDVGRTSADRLHISHAKAGVPITKEYLLSHDFPEDRVDYIGSLVERHSEKWRMADPSTDRNLIMLMEADLLDDAGALGIVMDCMITESRSSQADFVDCLDHINRYTKRISANNPMVTADAKKLWDEKAELVFGFTAALSDDIELSLIK